jgi:spore coat protein U-like protein
MKFYTFLFLSYLSFNLYAQNCNYNVNVNFFSGAITNVEQMVAHEISVSRPGNTPGPNCGDYRIYAGKGQANSYDRKAYNGSNFVSYNIYTNVSGGAIVKDFPDAGAGEFLSGSVPQPNTPVPTEFFVRIPDILSIFATPAGVYTDVIPFNVYAVRNNGRVEFQTQRFMTLSINIPRYAELSLVSQNAPHDSNSTVYTMDFGTLQSNTELSADLIVVGNVGFSVMMSSLNGSRLMNQQASVPYQIKVGQAPYLSLSPAGAHFQTAMRYSGTQVQGVRYPLRVRLGQVSSQLPTGLYQDTITVTIQVW